MMRAPSLSILAALALGACDSDTPAKDVAVNINFEAFVGSEPAACGVDYSALGTASTTAQLADARLFVSNVELRKAGEDTWVALALDQNSDWQHERVALLDFEDGTGGCADSGTAAENNIVSGIAPAGDYDGVRFTVGLPFETNHIDNATAPAPLNTPGMFWVWRAGYKFLRVDFATVGGAVPRWNLHIGATGCVSNAPTTSPDEPCGRPNAATIALTGFNPETNTVALDLAKLVAGADISANVADSAPGCMSGPDEGDDCAPVFGSLGLDFATGLAGAAQTVFSVQ